MGKACECCNAIPICDVNFCTPWMTYYYLNNYFFQNSIKSAKIDFNSDNVKFNLNSRNACDKFINAGFFFPTSFYCAKIFYIKNTYDLNKISFFIESIGHYIDLEINILKTNCNYYNFNCDNNIFSYPFFDYQIYYAHIYKSSSWPNDLQCDSKNYIFFKDGKLQAPPEYIINYSRLGYRSEPATKFLTNGFYLFEFVIDGRHSFSNNNSISGTAVNGVIDFAISNNNGCLDIIDSDRYMIMYDARYPNNINKNYPTKCFNGSYFIG